MMIEENLDLRDNFKVGQRVNCYWCKNYIDSNSKRTSKQMKGKIIKLYEHFVLVDLGKYKESFPYMDISVI